MTFKISGKKFQINFEQENTWTFTERPGGWVIAENKEGKRVRLMLHSRKQNFSLSSRGQLWFGEVLKDRHQAQGSNSNQDTDLIAQFPGKVRKVLVQPNSEIAEGDALILVEAMKMEFAIRAPFAGKVVRILVREGQQLAPGDRFLDLEASPHGA